MKLSLGLAGAFLSLAASNTALAQSGDFLAAISATRSSDASSASSFLANALAVDPDEQALIRQQMIILSIEGDFDNALSYAQDFLGLDESDPLALSIVRVEAIKRQDWQTALSTLPLSPASRLDQIIEGITKAALLTGSGQVDEALVATEESFDAIGFTSLGNYARGLIHASQGNHELSSDFFAAFIARDPFQYPRMAELTAYALERTGDRENARTIYEALLETGAQSAGELGLQRLAQGTEVPESLTPSVVDIYTELLYVIARLLSEQDQANLAYQYAQEIGYLLSPDASLYPGYTEVIASSLLALERFEEAQAFYASLESVEEFKLAAILGQVQALSDQERFLDAIAMLDRADALLGGTAGIERQRGFLYFSHGDFEATLNSFEKWKSVIPEMRPSAAQFLFIAGIAAYRLDRFEEMEESLLKSLELRPDDANVLNFLAYSWVERGLNLERGFEMLNRAVELEPENGAIIDSLGWAYFQLGQYEEALPFLEQAFQINPWSWEIAEHVGDAYWKVGREREASYFWNRALDLPEVPEDHIEGLNIKLEEGLGDDTDAL